MKSLSANQKEVEPPIDIIWRSNSNNVVIPDEETLSNWLTCWSGKHTYHKDGGSDFEAFIPNHEFIQTFGELRRTLQ